jgi:hypothetical protein
MFDLTLTVYGRIGDYRDCFFKIIRCILPFFRKWCQGTIVAKRADGIDPVFRQALNPLAVFTSPAKGSHTIIEAYLGGCFDFAPPSTHRSAH